MKSIELSRSVLLVLGLCFSLQSFAQEACNAGDSRQRELQSQMMEASKTQPSVTQIIFKDYKLNETEAAEPCKNCSPPHPVVTNVNDIKGKILRYPHAPQLAFRDECLISANKNEAPTPQVSCKKNSAGKWQGTSSMGNDMCITKSFLKYQNAVISSFAGCAKIMGFEGIDYSSIYEKFSLESTFRPNYNSSNGVGSGQLVEIFIKDVQQNHRGVPFMKRIAQSTAPECEAAKIIAKKDLVNSPLRSDLCEFTRPGEGLERNVLYSLIGTETVWKKNLEPAMKDYLRAHVNHPKLSKIKTYVQTTAYGRGGIAEAKAAIRRLKGMTPDQFASTMEKPLRTRNGGLLNRYTSEIRARLNEIAARLPESISSIFKSAGGDACLTSF